MRKIFILFLFFVITEFGFSFSNRTKIKENTQYINGVIRAYGNEPFVELELITDNEKKYYLKGDTIIINELRNVESNKVSIKGIIKNNTLIVLEWKFVKYK